jgi:hypothetical protein
MVPVTAALIGLGAVAEPPETEIDPAAIPPEMAAQMKKAQAAGRKPGDLPKFEDVGKDYTKVVSTADGKKSLYTIWKRDKDAQMLAELPRNFEGQLLFMANTIAGGTMTAGVQSGDMYVQWKKYDKRLALIEPNFAVRSTGDLESQKGRERVFTDRVVLEVPIVAKGPGGGPVIDMDALLLNQSDKFFGGVTRGLNPRLSKITKAKAFPENVEIAFEAPLATGRFATVHYSIRLMPKSTGYKPRKADERIGYFTTTFRDIGDPGADTQWVRYINRWHLPDRLLPGAHAAGALSPLGARRRARVEPGLREGRHRQCDGGLPAGRPHRCPHGEGPGGRPVQLRPVDERQHGLRDRPEPGRSPHRPDPGRRHRHGRGVHHQLDQRLGEARPPDRDGELRTAEPGLAGPAAAVGSADPARPARAAGPGAGQAAAGGDGRSSAVCRPPGGQRRDAAPAWR